MKIGTIQSLACVGLGTLLGLLAATRDSTSSAHADALASPIGLRNVTPSAGDEDQRDRQSHARNPRSAN